MVPRSSAPSSGAVAESPTTARRRGAGRRPQAAAPKSVYINYVARIVGQQQQARRCARRRSSRQLVQSWCRGPHRSQITGPWPCRTPAHGPRARLSDSVDRVVAPPPLYDVQHIIGPGAPPGYARPNAKRAIGIGVVIAAKSSDSARTPWSPCMSARPHPVGKDPDRRAQLVDFLVRHH